MKKEKILENYFASNLYSNQEILQSIENTKKEFANKIVNIDINLNEFGVYVVTYYFETKENMFQKIMIKLKERSRKIKQLYYKVNSKNIRKINMENIKKQKHLNHIKKVINN